MKHSDGFLLASQQEHLQACYNLGVIYQMKSDKTTDPKNKSALLDLQNNASLNQDLSRAPKQIILRHGM